MKGRVEWATEWWPAEETRGAAEATVGAAWWMAQSANAMAVFTGFTKKAIFSYMGHELICFIVKLLGGTQLSRSSRGINIYEV